MSKAKAAWIFLASAALLGCGDGLDSALGLHADLRVTGGQYHEGNPPVDTSDVSGDGGTAQDEQLPTINGISTRNVVVRPGQAGKSLALLAGPGTRTVATWLEDDSAYWVVPVASESTDRAPDLDVGANVSFARDAKLGLRKLWFAAADKHGHYGAPSYIELTFVDEVPEGSLVIELSWTQDMDLDLIVQGPDGSVVSAAGFVDPAGNKIPSNPDAGVPFFYFDSNQGCTIDGDRRENAVFPSAPMHGTYKVFVRLARTCGFPESGFTVDVYRDGNKIASRAGQVYGFQAVTPQDGPDGPGLFVADVVIGH